MNAMQRKLPQVRIGDHDYVVDLVNAEFRHVSSKEKVIPMYALLEKDGVYEFWYNNKTAKVEADPENPTQRPELTRVVVDPIKMDLDYFIQLERDEKQAIELFAAGKSIYNDPDGIHALKERYAVLPIVNIYGTDFILDLQAKEFRKVDDATTRIPWDALKDADSHFILWYDATKKTAFNGTVEQAIQHGNVKAITLPPLDKMIRDGLARHEAQLKATFKKNHLKDNASLRQRHRGRSF